MLNIFGKKNLDGHFQKKIKVCGIEFTIKKIDAMNYLDGSKVMIQVYDTYKSDTADDIVDLQINANKKIRDHMTDVIMSGVVSPKLKRKADDTGQLIDDLFTDLDLVNGLYSQIVSFTFGKNVLGKKKII